VVCGFGRARAQSSAFGGHDMHLCHDDVYWFLWGTGPFTLGIQIDGAELGGTSHGKMVSMDVEAIASLGGNNDILDLSTFG